MPNIGPLELMIVLAIALIVLGPRKLPEVGRSIGRGMREFRDSLSGAAAADELDGGDAEDDGGNAEGDGERPAATRESERQQPPA